MSIIQVTPQGSPAEIRQLPDFSAPPGTKPKLPPTSPWPVILVGFLVLALFFGGIGTWAARAPLAGAVVSPGVIRVVNSNRVVAHLDGGIVKEILVRDGDQVAAGQVLLRLDDVQARAAVNLVESQYRSLLASQARLEAERDDKDTITFPQELMVAKDDVEVASMMQGQINLFNGRRKTLAGQIDVLHQQITQLQAQMGGAAVQQNAQDEQLKLIQDELASSRQLYAKGYLPKTQILALERAAAALSGQSGQYKGSKAAIKQTIGTAELQILQLQKERLQEITQQLSDTQDKVNEALTRLEAARDVLKRTVVTAPDSGTVLGLTANTVGGVIERGQRILQIVPNDQPLEIRASVRPEDIADVHAGLVAEVRLTAYNQRSSRMLHGTVKEVSADRIVSEGDPRGHYEINVAITDDPTAIEGLDVLPGMPAIVSIATQPRTVLEYIVGPFTDYFLSAMREK